MLEIKQFNINPEKIGLSQKALGEHIKLYEGYVKKTNEIREKLQSADKSVSNAVHSDYGELKRQETFALNGARLHEVYFGILSGEEAGKGPEDGVCSTIIAKYGSVEKWIEEMTACAMSSRGWVVTAYDSYLKEIAIINLDAHNLGPVFNMIPIVALDMYEHAYFMDYGTNKKAYIENFFKGLNWKEIYACYSI